MQTSKHDLQECKVMVKVADRLEKVWHSRLLNDCSQTHQKERESIVCWLLGEDRARFETLTESELEIVEQGMEYRYQILQKRYLGVGPTQAYRNLLNRLGSGILLRNKIRSWVALSRDRQRAVTDVIQELIQEILNSDRYIQQQTVWISTCTQDKRLRNSLLLASIEEYCLRPIRNQPLILYRFVNLLRRQERAGMTQVPAALNVQFISEELNFDESDSMVSLFDKEAAQDYEAIQNWEQQQSMRLKVQREFESYLEENIGREAVSWLRLYLQCYSPEAIAQILNLPIKQIYRLREKVSYHALRVFAMKTKPELVANWLEISLKEHNLGLTLKQWQLFEQNFTPIQQQIVRELKVGKNLETIAQEMNCKPNQIISEWSKIYLAAQALRSSSAN
jgi:hypothetical protein